MAAKLTPPTSRTRLSNKSHSTQNHTHTTYRHNNRDYQYNHATGDFTTAEGQYRTRSSNSLRSRILSINLPFVFVILLLSVYFSKLRQALNERRCRVAVDTKTGRIVMVGAGKARPVVTRPNVDPHRRAPLH